MLVLSAAEDRPKGDSTFQGFPYPCATQHKRPRPVDDDIACHLCQLRLPVVTVSANTRPHALVGVPPPAIMPAIKQRTSAASAVAPSGAGLPTSATVKVPF